MAETAVDLQLRELKDTISELNKLIHTLQETIAAANAREAELKTQNDNLRQQIDYLTKKLFGRSSEKHILEIPGQMSIFNEAEAEAAPALLIEEEAEATASPSARKPKTTQKEKFKGIRVEEVFLDIPEDRKKCGVCGTDLVRIGKEFVRREFDFTPARGKVIEYYSYTYNCPKCEERELPHIVKGKDGYYHMLHGMASASTVAWVMYQKYVNSIPLYRMEKDWKLYGVEFSRATMANWIISNAEDFFRPVYNYLHRELLKRKFLMGDETPTQVLKEPERRPETKSYMWVFRTGEDDGPPIIMYKYSETRAGDNAVDFLDGFSGYFMCDRYSGYNKLPNARRCSCWAHVRRYLSDAIPKGKQKDYTQPAVQGFLYVEQLFAEEAAIHKKYKDPEKIRNERVRREKPLLDGFWTWLDSQDPVRGSRLEKAVTYIRNRKPYLMTYLEDGRCSFSNNASERSVKPYVIGRKNWLFSDTPRGADSSALVYTMVETAKANGVNVYYYLKYLLEKCANEKMDDTELEALSPWNSTVKEEVLRMQQADPKGDPTRTGY